MNGRTEGNLDGLLRRLKIIVDLQPEEIEALGTLPITIRSAAAGQEIVREGDRPSQACLIIEGACCRFRILGDGGRQIFSYHIPGDIPDLHSLFIERMDHSLATLTKSKVAFIPHRALHHLIDTQPRIARYFWRETLVDASVFREWMGNIGRRPALSRIAHVICEMYVRYDAIGMAEDMTIPFPMTQSNLGDAQGLSAVHVNRIWKQLKADRLIRLTGKHLKVLDWEALASLGDFEPDYLHLPGLSPR